MLGNGRVSTAAGCRIVDGDQGPKRGRAYLRCCEIRFPHSCSALVLERAAGCGRHPRKLCRCSASARDEIRALARMLGPMHDAIDCATLAPATVRRTEQEACVPIDEGLGLDNHPARALADLMTLCDHGSPPASEASILFLGDPWTIRARVFLAAAREIRFKVRVGKRSRAVSSDATFVVDATRAPPGRCVHRPFPSTRLGVRRTIAA